jgi:hypothetical protein
MLFIKNTCFYVLALLLIKSVSFIFIKTHNLRVFSIYLQTLNCAFLVLLHILVLGLAFTYYG